MPKKKIPLASESTPWSGQPFAGLEIPGLESSASSEADQSAPPDPARKAPAKAGEVIIRKETSGRSGKAVLVLAGWSAAWTNEALAVLARETRQACGCGGTLRDREIELQGGDSSRVRRFLERRGFRVRGV
jgi:translation initiation factor 1